MAKRFIVYKCLAGFLLFIELPVSADPLVNNWMNPASAPWEGGTNWSLAQLPTSNQWVTITNDGYKGVGISASTVTNFPASMTVSNLTISAPPNALSTLLLNYFGTGTPLEVLNDCAIGTNGSIVNLYSAFEVGGQWTVNGGQYIEQGGTTVVVTNGGVDVIGWGSLNLTNATFQGSMDLFGGTVTQVEGQTSGKIIVDEGSYNLLSGTVAGECFFGDGVFFYQYGGTNLADLSNGDGFFGGTYIMYGGAAISSQAQIFTGTFEQFAGFANFGNITLGEAAGGLNPGNYIMTNGTLLSGTVAINNGEFTQSGGQHTNIGGLEISGFPPTNNPTSYNLSAGDLSSPAISLGRYGSFYQSGGTNTIQGDLFDSGSYYGLSSGVLFTSNTVLVAVTNNRPPFGNQTFEGEFFQTGGQHWVANTLSNSYYALWGGSLCASNIVLAGTLSVSNSALILNPGLFQFAGTLQLYGGSVENLGQMMLSSNSVIELMPGSHKVSFLNSSAAAWSNGVALLVINWNGSTNGGGSDQLIFGNSSSGLTPAQLLQVVFVNPAGFPPGAYPAQMLATGEVVPAQLPMLLSSRNRNGLILNWSGGFVLQSATNVQGPYSDVTNATSPYTNISFQLPRQFFRLHQ
jgi:hypothetical protein